MTSNNKQQLLIQELKKFYTQLRRFRDLVEELHTKQMDTGSAERQRESIREELVRKSGKLKPIVVRLTGKQYGQVFNEVFDVWTEALGVSPIPSRQIWSLRALTDNVNEAIGKLEGVSTPEILKEAIYPSDTPYDAYKNIKEIISLATKKLIVVDPYVDGTVVTLLENVQPKVQIQILTRNMKGDFELTGQKFKEQREKAQQGTLEIRKSGKLHDRFIVADEKAFQIGASLKDAGAKMCAINEFKGSDIKTMLKKIISGYWAEAEIVL
jgi:hypothetical protein